MVHGTVKGLLGLISTLVLVAVAALAGLAYRLSLGPVSLSFLTPSIEQAFARIGGAAARLDATYLGRSGDTAQFSLTFRTSEQVPSFLVGRLLPPGVQARPA